MSNLRAVHELRPNPVPRFDWLFRRFRKILQLPNRIVNWGLDSEWNPFTQTGAIANLLFGVAVVSGVVLLIWYRPSVHEAYQSLQNMESNAIVHFIRSVHRYSSDGIVLLILIHSLKYFFDGRIGGARWLAWITGFVSLFLLWFIGWTGYWLVWDERAAALALGTAKMLDFLPIISDPISRGFLTDGTVNSLLFFLVFFFHMLLPLAMAAGLWLHIQRLNRAKWLTKKPMTIAVLLSLTLISFIYPATSAAPASMSLSPQSYTIDIWYLLPIYFTDRLSGGLLWGLFLIASVVILPMPWIIVKKRKNEFAAVVNEDTCHDCRQCYVDCPYNAVSMVPRADGKFESVALVNPDKCVECGICAGACLPLSIELPHRPILADRRAMNLRRQEEEPFMAAYLCASSAASEFKYDSQTGKSDDLPGYRVEAVPCSGWVHARTIEHLLRDDTGGVLVVGCPPGECTFREGTDWNEERLAGIREPELRFSKVNFSRVKRILPESKSELLKEAAQFRETIKAGNIISLAQQTGQPMTLSEKQKRLGISAKFRSAVATIFLVGFFAVITLLGSDLSYKTPFVDQPELIVSFKHPGGLSENCRKATEEEIAAMPMHMRQEEICERRRESVRLKITVDGEVKAEKSYRPEGIWQDGNSIAIESLPLSVGDHTIKVEIGDSADIDTYQYTDEQIIHAEKRHRRVILFERGRGFTWH